MMQVIIILLIYIYIYIYIYLLVTQLSIERDILVEFSLLKHAVSYFLKKLRCKESYITKKQRYYYGIW